MDDRMNRAKFFGLLRGLPSGDLTQIQVAYWLAKNAHRPQTPRDNGDRYFEHPRRVAITLIERGARDKDTITTALLHDVVEDTNTPLTVIVDLFPNVIWERLYILSKYVPIFDPLTGQIHDRTKKPTEKYFEAIAGAEEAVRLVKLADRLDNIRDMATWNGERRQRYVTETTQYILPIAEKTDPWFLREINAAIAASSL
ncbi:MAG: bifunctional (p)ppGpp synthase/hydrolase SpoT [Candidatus Parcubacteria bacterium]